MDAAERGLMPLRFATLVSLLVHRVAVDRHGGGYMLPTTVVLHETAAPATWLRAGRVLRVETFTDRDEALEAVGLSE
jgi:hypothetical protein